MRHTRIVSWFSCGAASAVATKIAKSVYPALVVARCLLKGEHPDNDRFADECADWFGTPVLELRSDKYADHWQVIEERRYFNGTAGALCTTELKKKVRQDFQRQGDLQIFGYTADKKDQKRAVRLLEQNPEINAAFPLIGLGITKDDCYRMVQEAGIQLPMMYRLGYHNNNCIGCVKGGMGYWNAMREDFPDVFERMAQLEEKIGATCINGVSLRQLQPGRGKHDRLDISDCGFVCGENQGWKEPETPAPVPKQPTQLTLAQFLES